jgi:hypothetical protein
VLAGKDGIQFHPSGFNRDPTSVEDRISSIEHQIHHNLLELASIRPDRTEIGAWDGDQLNVLADQAPQHPVHSCDHLIQIQGLRLNYLLPAEGEQLTGEIAGALTGGLDFFQVRAHRVSRAQVGNQQAAVAHHYRKQVVEVVGDPARQSPNRFDFLSVPKPLLQVLSIANRCFASLLSFLQVRPRLLQVTAAFGQLGLGTEPGGAFRFQSLPKLLSVSPRLRSGDRVR